MESMTLGEIRKEVGDIKERNGIPRDAMFYVLEDARHDELVRLMVFAVNAWRQYQERGRA